VQLKLLAGGRNNPSGWPKRSPTPEEFLLGSIHHRHLACFFGDDKQVKGRNAYATKPINDSADDALLHQLSKLVITMRDALLNQEAYESE
jgi:hypothetical protein